MMVTMAKQPTLDARHPKHRVARHETDSNVRVEGPEVTAKGAHIWRITEGDAQRTIVTTGTSTSNMAKTVREYEDMLRRLAER